MKEAEAAQRDIIHVFKYNSSPGLAGGSGALFAIPNYFKISYMYRSEQNENLNQISACYCKGVDVDYAPDGQPSFSFLMVNLLHTLELSLVSQRTEY